MKLTSLAALGLALLATTAPAFAEDDAAAVTAAAFTVDMPIEALMADERAKTVLTTNIPGIDQHPAYDQFKTMSLKALAPFSQGMISEELLAKIASDLAAIK